VHSYNNILATGKQYSEILKANQNDVFFSAAKMFHAYGLGNSFSIPQHSKSTVVYCNDLITAGKACEIIDQNKVTVFCAVPRHYANFVNTNTYPAGRSLRICVSAGERLPMHIKEKFEQKTGVEIIDAIGSTEMLGFMLSSGRPVSGVDLKLQNEELLVRSESMFLGYYNQPTQNVENGWLRTGDLYDVNNNVYIHKGRVGDLVKINGNKIYTNLVEQEIAQLPGVQECSLIKFTNLRKIEKLKLYLVCDNYNKLKPKILNIGKKYRVAFLTELTNELPRTATGKIKKYAIH
jgi:acyl-coenzyme A synthetase/AMP-(fatty) acid ligase